MRLQKPSTDRYMCLDTETTGISSWKGDQPYAIGVLDCDGDSKVFHYFEFPVDPRTRKVDYAPDSPLWEETGCLVARPESDWEACRALLSVDCPKVMHNSKFDMRMLLAAGIELKGRVEDTHFAARVCYSDEFAYGLKPLAKQYFQVPDTELQDLRKLVSKLRRRVNDPRNAHHKPDWQLDEDLEPDYWIVQWAAHLGLPQPENLARKYCQQDVVRTYLLWTMYRRQMEQDPLLRAKYEFEMELQPTTMRMEARGMHVSRSRCEESRADCERRRDAHLVTIKTLLEENLPSCYRDDFNPNSHPQLAPVLFNPPPKGYGLVPLQRTPKGFPSTAGKALLPYGSHPFVREVVAFRGVDKGLDTFFGKYQRVMLPSPITDHPDFAIVHASLNQPGAKTGRFSSGGGEGLNLQQVSNPATSRGIDPVNARMVFGPPPGYFWYCPDYAQMEPRVFSDVGDIHSMLEVLLAGKNLGKENTNKAWGGRDNPRAIEAAVRSLELRADVPSTSELLETWKRLGWSPEMKHSRGSLQMDQLAEAWLATFDYDIVAAEDSVGKKALYSRAKSLLFNEIYGGGDDAAAELLYCPVDEARQCRKEFFAPFPEVRKYMKSLSAQAARDGYIITRYDRKLAVPHDASYKAVNYMVQGTCADLMKKAVLRCDRFLRDQRYDAHLVMTIHDEIIFEIHKKHAHIWLLRRLMQLMADHEGRLRVPMPVEMKRVRERWDVKEDVLL